MAQDVAGFSQTGQYNYKRMMAREDWVSANLMIADFAKHAMKLYHHMNTSYETYLRGEISTYSDKMLQLYGGFVMACAQSGRNIAEETIANTGCFYGYQDLDSFEASVK